MPSTTDPLRNEVRIAAPPEVVFPYFTDPARMVDWMGVGVRLHLGDDHRPPGRPGRRGERAPYFKAGAPLPR